MAYRIHDMLCELDVDELKEIQAFLDDLIEEKQTIENENGN
jgi:hypothetical protein